jgi:hypothetical protein
MLNGRWLMAAATTVLFRSAKIFQKEIFFESGCTNRSDFGQGVQRHPGAPSAGIARGPSPGCRADRSRQKFSPYCCRR